MNSFEVIGGKKLKGEIVPQGAKNEALQIINAVLLTAQKVTITNIPDILDVNLLIELLGEMNVKIERPQRDTCIFQADDVNIDYLLSDAYKQKSGRLRGSVMLAGPLLEGSIPTFSGVSRMPAVRRDIAFSVAESVAAGAILKALREALPALVREVEVFDQYRGKGVDAGEKSLALRIVMQDTDSTLTDSEVEAVVASARDLLREKFKAKPRT